MFRTNNEYAVHNLGYSQRKPFNSIGQKNQNTIQRKHPSSSMRQFLQVQTKENAHHTRNGSEYQTINGYKNLTPLVRPDSQYVEIKQNSEYFPSSIHPTSPMNMYNNQVGRTSHYQYHNEPKNHPQQQGSNLTLQLLEEKIISLGKRVLINEQSLKVLNLKPIFSQKKQKDVKQFDNLWEKVSKEISKQQQAFMQNIQAKLTLQTQYLTQLAEQFKQHKNHLHEDIIQKISCFEGDIKLIKQKIAQNENNLSEIKNQKTTEFSIIADDIKNEFQAKFVEISNQITQISSKQSISQYTVSTFKCLSSITKFKYSESIEILPKQMKLSQNIEKQHGVGQKQIVEHIYCIDNQGFLLDHNHYYILNTRNKKIKLNKKQLQILKKLQKQ